MAFNTETNDSGRSGLRKSRFRGTGTISEINVVPFVDILLVLLVIFMLTAHVMEYGLEVEVPEVSHDKQTAELLPVITVTRNGSLYLGDKEVNINKLPSELHARFPKAKDVYVRADSALVWQSLAQVISELNDAKVKVKLVTKPVDTGKRRR